MAADDTRQVHDIIPVTGGQTEISRLEVVGTGTAGTGTRILLLPAGEQSNTALGDPLACARQLAAHPDARDIRLAYPHYAQPPGWYPDRELPQASPERAVLTAALQWTAVDGAPLYLMGFSKSGFAALSILARHWRKGLFAGAAAWDAPLMLTGLTRASMVRSYGTESAFSQYCLVDRIPDLAQAVATAGMKLVLDGYMVWGVQMRRFHELLLASGIGHVYAETRRTGHCWDPAWMATCAHGLAGPGVAGAKPAAPSVHLREVDR